MGQTLPAVTTHSQLLHFLLCHSLSQGHTTKHFCATTLHKDTPLNTSVTDANAKKKKKIQFTAIVTTNTYSKPTYKQKTTKPTSKLSVP